MESSPNRIVVGVDGSPSSVRALEWGLQAAKATGDEVEVLLVWADPWSFLGPPSLAGVGREGRARLRAMLADRTAEAVARVGAEAVVVRQRVVAGHPAETLVTESKSARMLVVGTMGLTALRRFMLGSVSQRCAQLAHIPVVIVPMPHETAETAGSEQGGSTAAEHLGRQVAQSA